MSVFLTALGVVAGTVLLAPMASQATISDGDVVLGDGPFVTNCTPGTDVNCSDFPTDIVNASGGNAFEADTSGTIAGAIAVTARNPGDGVGVEASGGEFGVFGGSGATGVLGTSSSPYTIGQSGHSEAGLSAENTSTGTALWAKSDNNGGQGAYIEAHGSNSTALQVCGCDGATALNVSGPLKVSGPVQMSRSGIAAVAGTVSAPKNSVKVSVSPVTSQSIMTATLQKYVPGVFVVAAVPNPSGGYFTIYLNKAVTTSVGPIAWVVAEHPFIAASSANRRLRGG